MAATVSGRVALPSDQESTGRTLGEEELAALAEVITSGVLTSTKGTQVAALERAFAELHGVRHAVACASGSAAVHTAIAAIDPEPGAEVVTTSVTDMGALAPIVYQGAIPVFADVDERTGNVTPASVEERCTDRTVAIVATHLFGNPCDMAGILEVGARLGVPVVEDAAQAFLAESGGRLAGTMGRIGCFSLQQGKHVTTGEGGMVVADDAAVARQMLMFVNKAWPYGEPQPDHEFLALNYRMNELTGAVGVAQLAKLAGVVEARRVDGGPAQEQLSDVSGIALPWVAPDARHSWWKYPLLIDGNVEGGAVGIAAALARRGSHPHRGTSRNPRSGAASSRNARRLVPANGRSPSLRVTRSIGRPPGSRAPSRSSPRCWCCRGTSDIRPRTSTPSGRRSVRSCTRL